MSQKADGMITPSVVSVAYKPCTACIVNTNNIAFADSSQSRSNRIHFHKPINVIITDFVNSVKIVVITVDSEPFHKSASGFGVGVQIDQYTSQKERATLVLLFLFVVSDLNR